MWHHLMHSLNVGKADSDIFGHDIPSSERGNLFGKGDQLRLALLLLRIAPDHALSPAERQISHRRFISHCLREPKHIGKSRIKVGIGPHSASAEGRSQSRVMDCDDRLKTGGRIGTKKDLLM